LEHTFRFLKQMLNWTLPRLRSPEQADRWTWLVVVAYAQLRLARPLVAAATDSRAGEAGVSAPLGAGGRAC
jgi:hypothetical protein